ncbi:hypothetical protein GCT13_13495 [Paraburkholderia sp. CNPSo 3157]|uniref:Uncharacterized protein n=1 Tax=Paraburkholderia franconis TaxID=2654983 RepID=A0A7X1TFZ6_9BURK|nr:hypothetical protein [Paraburkholderia franconis]MPW17925.1 hypothetical protein [Paraburkholderia franconis]
MRFVTEFVALDDLAGPVDPADRVSRHAEDLRRLGRAYAFSLRDVHVIPQCFPVVSITRCAASVMLDLMNVLHGDGDSHVDLPKLQCTF